MIGVAVVGAGHWGPNLLHNFADGVRSRVCWVTDLDPRRLEAVRARFPAVRLTTDAAQAIGDTAVDAVVIATPTATHHALARAALAAGKHVLVEKPLATSSALGAELVELAHAAGKVLLVGHVFLYNPAVRWVKQHLDAGRLGRVYYLSTERTNLGPVRTDVDAAWDLAAQDLAIFDHWLGATPVAVAATGGAWINPGVADAVFATVRYPADVLAHLHVSWLNPRKVRDITVVADHGMLTYDDMNVPEPIRIYDKQVTRVAELPDLIHTFAAFRANIRDGDISIPKVPMGEPLRAECEHFLDCIEGSAVPLTGGEPALAVLRTLEALTRSMHDHGRETAVAR